MSGAIFHFDLDAFFASVEQRDNPSLRGKPVIVGGPLGGRGVVATASYEARKYGLYSGMPLSRAQRLCPHGIFLEGDYAKYEEASSKFLKILEGVSPTLEPLGLDEVFVDLTGTELLWKDFTQLAFKTKDRVKKEIGITVSCGLSWQKTCAKVASGINKPDGFYKVEKGQERKFLAPLPLKELPGAGQATVKFLNSFGIYTIGDLAGLGLKKTELFLGKHGLALWQIATGQDDSSVTPPPPPKSVSRSTTFPFDSKNEEFVKGILFYLCQRVAADLRSYDVEGRVISLVIRTYQFVTASRQQAGLPTSTAKEIYGRALALLGQLWNKRIPLRLIGVGVSHFDQRRFQASLFEKKPFLWQRIEEVGDKIRERYGFFALQPASVLKLKKFYPQERRGFRLATPSLSR